MPAWFKSQAGFSSGLKFPARGAESAVSAPDYTDTRPDSMLHLSIGQPFPPITLTRKRWLRYQSSANSIPINMPPIWAALLMPLIIKPMPRLSPITSNKDFRSRINCCRGSTGNKDSIAKAAPQTHDCARCACTYTWQ